jgi:hypothetical protein
MDHFIMLGQPLHHIATYCRTAKNYQRLCNVERNIGVLLARRAAFAATDLQPFPRTFDR